MTQAPLYWPIAQTGWLDGSAQGYHDAFLNLQLGHALYLYLCAPDWFAAYGILTCQPILLTEKASDVLHNVAFEVLLHGSQQDALALLSHKEVLDHARRYGVKAVLEAAIRARKHC